jgi:hypothetical protein
MSKTKLERAFKELTGAFQPRKSDSCYDYEINTKYGVYSFDKPFFQYGKKGVSAIFGRFAEPKRAYDATGCNPHSGKLNFFCSDNRELLERFERFLNKIGESNV